MTFAVDGVKTQVVIHLSVYLSIYYIPDLSINPSISLHTYLSIYLSSVYYLTIRGWLDAKNQISICLPIKLINLPVSLPNYPLCVCVSLSLTHICLEKKSACSTPDSRCCWIPFSRLLRPMKAGTTTLSISGGLLHWKPLWHHISLSKTSSALIRTKQRW